MADPKHTDLEHAQLLAAALAAVLYDAHPSFASTAKWSGGIGGQAITSHCSLTQGAAPGTEWAEAGIHEDPLREFLADHPDFDLQAARAQIIAEWKRRYDVAVQPRASDG